MKIKNPSAFRRLEIIKQIVKDSQMLANQKVPANGKENQVNF